MVLNYIVNISELLDNDMKIGQVITWEIKRKSRFDKPTGSRRGLNTVHIIPTRRFTLSRTAGCFRPP
jgi:hypothetical protein